MRVTVFKDRGIVVFRYRDYDISIVNGTSASCEVYDGPTSGDRINKKSFSADAEGIRKAMTLIDKVAGPRRICSKCKKPIATFHKWTQSADCKTYIHRCCEYPEAYTAKLGKMLSKR